MRPQKMEHAPARQGEATIGVSTLPDERPVMPPWLPVLAATAYLPLAFLGYGADIDSYEVVAAGEHLMAGGGYVPARNPGFPVHEVATGILNHLGGSVATNVGTLAMALIALWGFHRIGAHLRVPQLAVLTAFFAFHPLVWAAAAETMDYAWALGFGLAGGALLLDRRWPLAGILFGLAIGARLTSVLLIVPFLVLAAYRYRAEIRGVMAAAGIGFGLGALLYVPVLLYYGGTLDFLVPTGADEAARWRLTDRLGRFAYKNVYAWGLPGTLVMAALLGYGALRRRVRDARHKEVLWLTAGVFVLYQILFLRFPLQVQYLLPAVPFVLLAAGVLLSRPALLVAMATVLMFNAFSLNVARPDDPLRARQAEVGLWLEPGHLVAELARRWQVRTCRDEDCWYSLSENGRFPDVARAGYPLLGEGARVRIGASAVPPED